jgi:hypothetical protein
MLFIMVKVSQHKYFKYKTKNQIIGGNVTAAIQAILLAKQGAEKVSDTVRVKALAKTKEAKKELTDEKLKSILGKEEYNELHKNLDLAISILEIKNLKELHDKRKDIVEVINKINGIIQGSNDIKESDKKMIAEVVDFLNMLVKDE